MNHSFIAFILTGFLLFSCGKVTDLEEVEKISRLEEAVKKEAQENTSPDDEPNLELYQKLADSYLEFVQKYPEAKQSPIYLYRAAQLYNNELELNNKVKAMELFTRNYQQYPGHETAGNSMFFVGYYYHNTDRDLTKAEKIYTDFLDKYPDNRFASSAEQELKYLGKSPEEILQAQTGGMQKSEGNNEEEPLNTPK